MEKSYKEFFEMVLRVLKPIYLLISVMFIPNITPILLASIYNLWWLLGLLVTIPFSLVLVILGMKENWFKELTHLYD